jgi:hypothetical protein
VRRRRFAATPADETVGLAAVLAEQ